MQNLPLGDPANVLAGSPVDANLKTRAALGKPTTFAIPPVSVLALGAAMEDGARKYGVFNWRGTGVTASVFFNAMERHLLAWRNGEDFAPDSGIHHLAHLMASAAILLDAEACGVYNDDRPETSLYDGGNTTTPWKRPAIAEAGGPS